MVARGATNQGRRHNDECECLFHKDEFLCLAQKADQGWPTVLVAVPVEAVGGVVGAGIELVSEAEAVGAVAGIELVSALAEALAGVAWIGVEFVPLAMG